MNDSGLVGMLLILATLPGLLWAWNDYRSGNVRLMLFSRMRSPVRARREIDPQRFWAYLGFNILLFALMLAGGLYLILVKP
ncbi:DUF2542 family protein [Novosphingobium malaysiense]|uniref:Uncharacterized protein n=1 Tax=Novosphingobium malaysiense TaxID=1348853 RepID=A0A0B1ZL21_9SPHN|nr:DUF2542 family protein [Novosphingobium malaysiense]KHK89970.1 hypothetical protein LK12_18955 [Novosphingobium malaysiense]